MKKIPTDLTGLRDKSGCFFFMKFSKSIKTILKDQTVSAMNQPNDFCKDKYKSSIYFNRGMKKKFDDFITVKCSCENKASKIFWNIQY